MTSFLKYINSVTVHLNEIKNSRISKPLYKNIVLISPHPDDESIQASLPLRLLKENECNIVNICMTLGSNVEQQERRELELNNAINILGFNNIIYSEINEKDIANSLRELEPDLIICPHLNDNHYIHKESSSIVHKVLKNIKYYGTFIENEYWSEIDNPNLLIEFSSDTVSIAMDALSKHIEEVARNPYHLTMPHWMINNSRRGSEIVQNHIQPNQIGLSQLYRKSIYENGTKSICEEKVIITKNDGLDQLF